MPMHNPPHPGPSIRDLCLEPLGLTIGEGAKRLRVSRKHLSAVVNERAPISATLAIRLAAEFGSSAETWLRMQIAYDLWQAQARERVA